MKAPRALSTLALAGALGLISVPALGQSFRDRVIDHKPPKLVVVISIDQFRADYIRRLNDLFLPARTSTGVGGFNYLLANGAAYLDCRYDHFPTYTGPGHAAILTGTGPANNGIVGNVWFDREKDKNVYCVEDPSEKVVGAAPTSKARPMGPANLKSSTVGDELKLATAGNSKVVTIAIKDRASILLGGHKQDVALWFDEAEGRWISSTAYAKDGKLPEWVEAINRERIPARAAGKVWKVGVSKQALNRSFASRNPGDIGYGTVFPHQLSNEVDKAIRQFTFTPWANFFVLQSAAKAVKAEKLGQREFTDLLAINLSTNDYVGHQFGPYSPEALDLTVETDKALSEFFNQLDKTVPGGLNEVVIALTADHGVSPVPEDAGAFNIPGGRIVESELIEKVNEALDQAYGKRDWFLHKKAKVAFVEPYLYLSNAAMKAAVDEKKAPNFAAIRRTAAQAVQKVPGIYWAATLDDILSGSLPATEISHLMTTAVYPALSGDVLVIQKPFNLIEGKDGTGTSHGTPWAYDLQVPMLICGGGVKKGIHTQRVAVQDLAPTISQILGIIYPNACTGKVLPNALD